MKIIHIFITSILVIASFTSCSNKEQSDQRSPEAKEQATSVQAEHDEGGSSSIATITAEQMKAVGIILGNFENKNLTATIKANGALRVPNNNKANATSLYGGVIKTLRVQMGDHVSKGQVIATIENPQFIQLQEEYLTIDSRIVLAGQEMQRQKELNEGNAGALKNLQNATAELNALRTRKASLYRQIQLMGIIPSSVSASNLRSALVVTSPVNGTVSAEFAKIGSYVDVSSPVVEVVNNSLLHLDLQVFEKDLPHIKIGQSVNFTLTNNPTNTYTAKVFNIGSSFENESKTVAVHCTVTGNKTGLIDGMNITGMISIDNVPATTVPNDAIVEADGKNYIFIQTDKVPEAPAQEEDGHEHEAGGDHAPKEKLKTRGATMNFEKVEIVKGVSELGYTAVTPVKEISANAKLVTKGAFFINAKLANAGGHEH
ncbi:efflux RND transporter periplasmic adaptor subunit [Niabella yanshanensis]|uniref:Efflux RND transporter periplasmic adaptor subunit n=1 Tax=Niabella yanshanensis TaxID=577386 RepID=A0ABZ0W6U5_9BACT|nr:efflux RND transporter periplasmic adaptor subunit [Niabella yanshanensis]WQD37845.1 efflux RND transporter periplasmic adaptor subunit [Niabella yanshanensis]